MRLAVAITIIGAVVLLTSTFAALMVFAAGYAVRSLWGK